jgi:hypothetical protein
VSEDAFGECRHLRVSELNSVALQKRNRCIVLQCTCQLNAELLACVRYSENSLNRLKLNIFIIIKP